MRFIRIPAALIAALILVPAVLPRAEGQSPTMPGYPAVGSPATVTLLAPGSAPRTLLRYKVASGYKGTMDMTMAIGMSMNVGGMAMPMDAPPVRMSATIDVVNVAANGDLTYSLTFTDFIADAGGNPMMAAAYGGVAASIKTLKATGIVSNRGTGKPMTLDVSAIADPATKQAMSQISSSIDQAFTVFPEEAVGIGARWEARQATSTGGVTTFQKAEYEVVSINGSAVSLKVKMDATAPAQPVINPDLPPGVEASLDKLTGTGTGTATVRLDSLVPTSTIEMKSSMAMNMNVAGQTQSMATDTTLKMTIAPSKK